MHPVETYLKELREIRSTGGAQPETSYYGALERLLNEVGKKLKPKVRCVSQLANAGAGAPDYGLYAAHQFQKAKDFEPLLMREQKANVYWFIRNLKSLLRHET